MLVCQVVTHGFLPAVSPGVYKLKSNDRLCSCKVSPSGGVFGFRWFSSAFCVLNVRVAPIVKNWVAVSPSSKNVLICTLPMQLLRIYTIILLKFVCRCSQTAGRNSCSIMSGDISNCSYQLSVLLLASSHLSSA